MALTGLDLLTPEFWDKSMCRCVWAPFLFLPSTLSPYLPLPDPVTPLPFPFKKSRPPRDASRAGIPSYGGTGHSLVSQL